MPSSDPARPIPASTAGSEQSQLLTTITFTASSRSRWSARAASACALKLKRGEQQLDQLLPTERHDARGKLGREHLGAARAQLQQRALVARLVVVLAVVGHLARERALGLRRIQLDPMPLAERRNQHRSRRGERDEGTQRVDQHGAGPGGAHATQCQVANAPVKNTSEAAESASAGARARGCASSQRPSQMLSGKSTSTKRGSDISGSELTG